MTRVGVLMPVASPWAREAARGLAAAGCEVHVVDFALTARGSYLTMEDPLQRADIRRLEEEVASVHFIDFLAGSGARYLGAAPLLAARMRDVRADVLLTLYAGGSAVMAWASRVRPFAVFTVGSDVLLLEGRLRRALTRRCLTSAALVLANGRHLAERTRGLAPGARVEPLYLGVDTRRFAPREARTPGPLRVVCTRGFSENYNNEQLVDAVAAMDADGVPAFEVVFTSPGPTLAAAVARADRVLPPSLRARVTFHGGLPSETLEEVVRDADVFVSTSRSDGTATSLLEALACGAYPVLSDIPANREWVGEGAGEGALVPLDDPSALARALEGALRDADARERAASVNVARVRRLADGSRNMASLCATLTAVAGRGPAPETEVGVARVG